MEPFKRVHKKSRETFGILRITAQLHKENIPCGKNRVARIMRESIARANIKLRHSYFFGIVRFILNSV
ncbi:MAG: IS3 family transposase [Caldicoprobacterales bacterium]